MTAPRTSYDEVPYESHPFPQTHPSRLAALATLLGMAPAPPARARILELGCAAGGNLIPMAVALPDAELVGVDLSSVQVAQGRAAIDASGLKNVRLHAMSIDDFGDDFGRFDYIVAHGVYSWVPAPVQERLLAICGSQLAPAGVAYVSYNTLPGWHMRGMIRELMRYHAMRFAEPGTRVAQARGILDFLARWVPTADNAYGLLLQSELEWLRGQPDHYILHEHLEDANEPLYFHQFVERAARHGLTYLAEADFGTMLASNFPDEVAQTIRRIAGDVVRQEQFMDFLRNRTFRQTLLVRADSALERTIPPARVTGLWVSAALRHEASDAELAAEGTDVRFSRPDGAAVATGNRVTKTALVLLAGAWPRALAFGDLLAAALDRQPGADSARERDTLASDILQCYAAGLIELHGMPSAFTTDIGERPVASALARHQAASGGWVTTLLHGRVQLDGNLRRLLALLDGTRTRAALVAEVTRWALQQPAARVLQRQQVEAQVRQRVDAALGHLARSALLQA